ncbi:MAG: cation:dicarboxylase symporter family transporter [Bacteroidetes bacterium]|nr:cation:dicarboxylase symporter family transporter [Bacteroidota bacterium]
MKFPKLTLTKWIFVGITVGLLIGWLFPNFGTSLKPLSTIFIRLIKSIIAPLIFSTLILGIAGHGNLKQVGRMGIKSLIYFEVVTTIALFIGLFAVNLTQPGVGVDLAVDPNVAEFAAKKQSFSEIISHIIPQSIIEAMAHGEVLQIVLFSVLFSIALASIKDEKRSVILNFCDSLAETMFKFTSLVMKFAPIGVGAAIAVTVGSKGIGILLNLGLLILTLYGALIVFVVFVLGSVMLIARIPIKKFIATVKEPAIIAFSTTSSEAALPKAMEVMEKFGVPRRIVSFVIPTGYGFNLDGSTLYLSLAAIFVAQAANIQLSIETQILMMLSLMVTSKGVAGVPRASLVILAGTLASFGLPLEGVAIILGVDEILDMGRTAVNVIGNCLASAVIARWEGELNV